MGDYVPMNPGPTGQKHWNGGYRTPRKEFRLQPEALAQAMRNIGLSDRSSFQRSRSGYSTPGGASVPGTPGGGFDYSKGRHFKPMVHQFTPITLMSTPPSPPVEGGTVLTLTGAHYKIMYDRRNCPFIGVTTVFAIDDQRQTFQILPHQFFQMTPQRTLHKCLRGNIAQYLPGDKVMRVNLASPGEEVRVGFIYLGGIRSTKEATKPVQDGDRLYLFRSKVTRQVCLYNPITHGAYLLSAGFIRCPALPGDFYTVSGGLLVVSPNQSDA